MPYTKVQFIAYCIHTGPKDLNSKQQYIGITPTLVDIAERVKLVGNAIKLAKEASSTKQSDPKTLKIFMMPEFLFRGSTGAYSLDEIQTTINALQQLVKDSEWQHWLFIFGSIIGKSAPAFWGKNSEGKWRMVAVSGSKQEVYNIVLVQKGGFGDQPEAGPSAAKVVMKEHMSDMDFIKSSKSNGGLVYERVVHLSSMSEKERSEVQQKEYDGSSVFEVDGIRFGLEVCLDHSKQRLKKSKNLPPIDIQLVPSCGMKIKEDAIVARTKGYIFHCDGYANYSENKLGYDSRVKKVTANKSYTEILPLISFPPYNVQVNNIRVKEIYALGAGQIRVYPEQPLIDLSRIQSVFPNDTSLTFSLADEPILLNGMKVIFDQPVGVYPVALESQAEVQRSGN